MSPTMNISVQGQKAIAVLEMAVHPLTSDKEVLSAIFGFRRIAKGTTLGQICEEVYGTAYDRDWQNLYFEQQREIARLRAENKKLKTPDARSENKAPDVCSDMSGLRIVLTDAEWAVILPHLPAKRRTVKGRERIGAIFAVLRVGGGWRFLEKYISGSWRSYYNQYQRWRDESWWGRMVEALEHSTGDRLK